MDDMVRADLVELDQVRAKGREGVLPRVDFLAVSGGGANGAFGAGLLCVWSESGTRPTFKAVTGTSTGALTAPFAFLEPDYDYVQREVYTQVRMIRWVTTYGTPSTATPSPDGCR